MRLRDARIAAAAVTALGFALRWRGLRALWIHPDEGIYYQVAHAPPQVASAIIHSNAHPPLYYHLLRIVATFGDDFTWLCAPALVCGTLAVAALYRVGERAGGPLCGLVCAALLAVSPGAIALSQVARPYAAVVLALACGVAALQRHLETGRTGALFGYTAWMLVAVGVHYSAYLALVGIGLTGLAAFAAGRLSSPAALRLALAHAPIAAVAVFQLVTHVAPVMLDSAMRAEALGAWLGQHFAATPAGLWSNFVGLFDYLAGRPFAGVAALAYLASLAVGLAGRRFVEIGACVAVLAVAALASAAGLYPFGATRHAFFLASFIALPYGLAAAQWRTAPRGAALGAAAALALAVVARGPIASALGLGASDPLPEPERSIPVDEIGTLRGPLRRASSEPGILIMDLSTAYTVLPLIGAPATQSDWRARAPLRGFDWGRRRVVVVPHWQLAADAASFGRRNHLWTQIRRLRAEVGSFPDHLLVLSADGRRVAREIRSSGETREERRALVEARATTPHFALLRVAVESYREALARAVRARAARDAQ